MATERQYSFFKTLYEEENERGKTLSEHAKNNLTLTTVYSAFVLLPFKNIRISGETEKWIFICGVLLMILSILISLWATNIATYEAVTEPEKVLDKYGVHPPNDEDFFDDRIIDFSVAYRRNTAVNDAKASHLYLARYILLGGVALHATYVIINVL